MNIIIKTKEFELTSSLSEYVHKKFEPLGKFLNKNADSSSIKTDVTLGKSTGHHHSGDIFKAEVTIAVGGRTYHAASEKESIYAAIDDVKDELNHELQVDKEKRLHFLRKGGQKVKDMVRGVFKNKNK